MVCSQHRHHNTLLRLRISGGLNQEASNTSIPYRWQGSVRLSTLVPGGLNKGLRRVLCDSLVSYMRQWRTLPRNQMSRASDGFGGDERAMFGRRAKRIVQVEEAARPC